MIRLGMKNYSTILIEKRLKYQLYHLVKFKYEYFTGEDILPSNQQQRIEQTKFTYSPFEKKKKTIEEQDQKQIDALENLKDQNKQLLNVDVNDDYENKLLHSKEQEIFRKICNKRLDKIDEVTKRLSVIISYLLH